MARHAPTASSNHTVSGVDWQNLWFNGTLVGETGINAALCGHWDCPVLLVTGDRAAGREATALLGDGLTTVEVKEGLGSKTARMLTPKRARELVEEGREARALGPEGRRAVRPRQALRGQGRVHRAPRRPRSCASNSGVELVDDRTIVSRADDWRSAWKQFFSRRRLMSEPYLDLRLGAAARLGHGAGWAWCGRDCRAERGECSRARRARRPGDRPRAVAGGPRAPPPRPSGPASAWYRSRARTLRPHQAAVAQLQEHDDDFALGEALARAADIPLEIADHAENVSALAAEAAARANPDLRADAAAAAVSRSAQHGPQPSWSRSTSRCTARIRGLRGPSRSRPARPARRAKRSPSASSLSPRCAGKSGRRPDMDSGRISAQPRPPSSLGSRRDGDHGFRPGGSPASPASSGWQFSRTN